MAEEETKAVDVYEINSACGGAKIVFENIKGHTWLTYINESTSDVIAKIPLALDDDLKKVIQMLEQRFVE